MTSFNLLIFSFMVVFLLFVSVNNYNVAFGETLDSTQNDSIEMEGYFNILEIIYDDGTYEEKYYLFVDSPLANNSIPYQLEFTNPTGSLTELVSENVLVRGHIPTTAQFSNSISTVQIMADSIEKITSNPTVQNAPVISQTGVEGIPVPSELQSHVILSKFADQSFIPHSATYFENLFYNSTTGAYSLVNYYNDTSYGNFTIKSTGIHDWSFLQSNTNFFNSQSDEKIFNFTYQAITAAELAGGPIDFDGINNVTENDNPENLLKAGPNGDDIDHLFFIYNQNSFGVCGCAFAFRGPVGIQTPSNGEMFFLLSYLPDIPFGTGFAVDTSYYGGIGVPAHEFGHTLGWDHTHTPNISPGIPGPGYDPWSIMSKGGQTISENPAGPIAYNKNHANWIPLEDIITIGQSQTELFNLDKLSDASPGPGYLMAQIPFGSGNPTEFYTLEARIDDTFDHTPDDKTGLLMYHVNPNGHPGTFSLAAEAALVDINGALDNDDWNNANLVLDQNFTLNNITIRYLAHNDTSITVQVENFFSPSSCSLPGGSGDWTISVSCTLTTSASAPANVIVQDDVVLTIPAGKTLTVPAGSSFTVNSGGRAMIELGGTLIIVS